ncbi:MAG: winged helix-turn-helix domain-containing protein [Gemmatales bacterium]
MANKRLGTAAAELKLPTKKVKGEKKPKWQAKTGNKKAKDVEVVDAAELVVETPAQDESVLSPEPTETPRVATTPEAASLEPATIDEAATTNDGTTLPEPTATDDVAMGDPGTAEESTGKKPRKLKVKADAPPKKLSMVNAALQVLQDRKVAMTCPELIDVMATEGLWVSPGGKTPANTLYAAISRIIKEQGKDSAFRKAERGKFEAV